MVTQKQTWILMGLALAIRGGTAVGLARQQNHQVLGQPGVEVGSKNIYDPEGNLAGTNSVPLPERILDCDSRELPITREVLDWLPQDTTYAQRYYTNQTGFEMLVNVVLMGADRTSIHKPEYCLRGSGWGDHQSEQDTLLITEPHPYELPVMKMTTTRSVELPNGQVMTRKGIFVYWFVADQELTATHGQRMWWMARDMLVNGVLQRWAYVSAFSVCLPGREDATYEKMKTLMVKMVPEFQITTGKSSPLSKKQYLDITREARRDQDLERAE
jgi:hypothetical protein